MSNLLDSLAWLPPPPPDFTAICRGVHFGQRLQWLASHALDEIQLNQLAKQVARAREAGHSLAPLTPFKLGLISNATTDLICPALAATALRHGIALECVQAPFGQVAQQALSSGSEIKRARPDAVLVAADFRGLPLRPTPGDATAARETVTHVLDHLTAVREGIKQEGKAICILQTIARPAEPCFGSLDLVTPGTLRHLIDAACPSRLLCRISSSQAIFAKGKIGARAKHRAASSRHGPNGADQGTNSIDHSLGGATSVRFHQPPPNAWNKAAVSA
jgi:hypothetical protein